MAGKKARANTKYKDHKRAVPKWIILTLIFLGLAVWHIVKCSSYVPVNAEIVDAFNDYGGEGGYVYYAVVTYNYDSRRYKANKSTYLPADWRIGSEMTVKVNPNNPEEIENTHMLHFFIMFAVIFGAMAVCSILTVAKDNRELAVKQDRALDNMFIWNVSSDDKN